MVLQEGLSIPYNLARHPIGCASSDCNICRLYCTMHLSSFAILSAKRHSFHIDVVHRILLTTPFHFDQFSSTFESLGTNEKQTKTPSSSPNRTFYSEGRGDLTRVHSFLHNTTIACKCTGRRSFGRCVQERRVVGSMEVKQRTKSVRSFEK